MVNQIAASIASAWFSAAARSLNFYKARHILCGVMTVYKRVSYCMYDTRLYTVITPSLLDLGTQICILFFTKFHFPKKAFLLCLVLYMLRCCSISFNRILYIVRSLKKILLNHFLKNINDENFQRWWLATIDHEKAWIIFSKFIVQIFYESTKTRFKRN